MVACSAYFPLDLDGSSPPPKKSPGSSSKLCREKTENWNSLFAAMLTHTILCGVVQKSNQVGRSNVNVSCHKSFKPCQTTDTYCTGTTIPKKFQKQYKNSIRNANWNKFRSELEDKLDYLGFIIQNRDNLEREVEMLDSSIRKFFISSWPEKKIQNINIWWTNELNKLRNNTRRKLMKVTFQNIPAHWESYCEAQCWYKKAVKHAKLIVRRELP